MASQHVQLLYMYNMMCVYYKHLKTIITGTVYTSLEGRFFIEISVTDIAMETYTNASGI